MEERIYNLYAVVEKGIIGSVGIREYVMSGSDGEKEAFLASRADADFQEAEIFPVPDNYLVIDLLDETEDMRGIPYDCYRNLAGTSGEIGVYETALEKYGAPMEPLVHFTIVINSAVVGDQG